MRAHIQRHWSFRKPFTLTVDGRSSTVVLQQFEGNEARVLHWVDGADTWTVWYRGCAGRVGEIRRNGRRLARTDGRVSFLPPPRLVWQVAGRSPVETCSTRCGLVVRICEADGRERIAIARRTVCHYDNAAIIWKRSSGCPGGVWIGLALREWFNQSSGD